MHLINIRFSKNVSVKRHLSERNIFPAMLNSRSTDPEDAGTDNYRLANLLIAGGYMDVFSFQNCRGFASWDKHWSEKYVVTLDRIVSVVLQSTDISDSEVLEKMYPNNLLGFFFLCFGGLGCVGSLVSSVTSVSLTRITKSVN